MGGNMAVMRQWLADANLNPVDLVQVDGCYFSREYLADGGTGDTMCAFVKDSDGTTRQVSLGKMPDLAVH